MSSVRLIEVKESILAENDRTGEAIRERLESQGVFMLNVMASPGAGKTSLVLQTIRGLRAEARMAVIEADIDSMVDAEKVASQGIAAVQLRTGGACHVDALMVDQALGGLDLANVDLLILENVGNLVCPAEFDTGATKRVMILSIPEGDDKPLKYPLMFSVCDAIVVNKIDYLPWSDFNLKAFEERVLKLNPRVEIFKLSCKTGEGVAAWLDWLRSSMAAPAGRSEKGKP